MIDEEIKKAYSKVTKQCETKSDRVSYKDAKNSFRAIREENEMEFSGVYHKTSEQMSYALDEDRLIVNIVEYTTTTPEDGFWEAHKNYLDVHVMIHGNEQIDLNFIQNMELKDFVEKDDFLPMDGEKNSSVVLTDGDFLICYPSDGHRTAVQVQEPEAIKKAIFKVKI